MSNKLKDGLDANGYPTKEGVYNAKGIWGDMQPQQIEVYIHPTKGFCCFCDDFGSGGTKGVNDATDCHVSVQFTGLEFIARIGELEWVTQY